MAQSITTKYLAPTNTKGGRIKATTASGLSTIVSWRHEMGIDDNHECAMLELCAKLGWHGLFVKVWLKDGSAVWTNIQGVKPVEV